MQFTRPIGIEGFFMLELPALLSRSYTITMGKRTERNLSGWETEIPRKIQMGLDSDSEKEKIGASKVNQPNRLPFRKPRTSGQALL